MAQEMVTLTLAHPLSKADAEKVLATEVRSYGVEEQITVPRGYAKNLIDSGRVKGVDFNDRDAVEAAMRPDKPAPAEPPAGPAVAQRAKADKASGEK